MTSIRVLTRQAERARARTARARSSPPPPAARRDRLRTLTAAILIGRTAGAERFAPTRASPARAGIAPIPFSSGKRDRHRLHRGGDRQLNRALHTIAITRARRDPETRAYLQRKMAEGKTRKEALRCLKRHLARRFHRLLTDRSPRHQTTTINASLNIACLT